MKKYSSIIIFFAILPAFYNYKFDAIELGWKTETQTYISQCFHSMCQAVDCTERNFCNDDRQFSNWQGPLQISREYWVDAGQPRVNAKFIKTIFQTADKNEYEECVCNYECALETASAFMMKKSKDCNNDGAIDCDDYLKIHQFGLAGCFGNNKHKSEISVILV